jgi:hypothetical protein
MERTDLPNVFLGAFENQNSQELDIDVCIVNLGDEPIMLEMCSGSFAGDMDGLMELGRSRYRQIEVPAMGTTKVDHFSDEGELDFTTFYNIRIGSVQYLAQINGWDLQRDKLVDIAPLGRSRCLVGFCRVGKKETKTEITTWRRRDTPAGERGYYYGEEKVASSETTAGSMRCGIFHRKRTRRTSRSKSLASCKARCIAASIQAASFLKAPPPRRVSKTMLDAPRWALSTAAHRVAS